jgi:hypothetical protein
MEQMLPIHIVHSTPTTVPVVPEVAILRDRMDMIID